MPRARPGYKPPAAAMMHRLYRIDANAGAAHRPLVIQGNHQLRLSPGASEGGHVLRGVLLVVVATFLFSASDVAFKHLVASYPAPLLLALRYLTHLTLMIAFIGPVQGRTMFATHRTGLVLIRTLCIVTASILMGWSLELQPVAESLAIYFLAPLLVVLLAKPLLGERIGPAGWVAAALGFSGVLLVIRPGGALDPLGTVFMLANAAFMAVYILLTRVLAGTERTVTLLLYVALTGAILFGLSLPFYWEGFDPSLLDVVLLLSIGASAMSGHCLFTAAYRFADASLLSPIIYLQLLWAGVLSWLAFGHVPDGLSLLGMAIIVASGAVVTLRSRAT
jgi:drug/metabolite transporter (DMT)-like permease